MVVTVAVRVADPTGWLGSDDASYHSAAEHLLAGKTIQRVHHHYARMAVIVPVAVSMCLFGNSPAAAALPMFVGSVLCVAMVTIVGRLLWGWWVGLCAATVVSVLPFFLAMSTTSYTDALVCFWATLAVLLAVAAARTANLDRAMLLGVACGVSVGLAASAKVFAILALLAVVPIAWEQMPRPRRVRGAWLAAVGCGMFFLFVADGLFYSWAAGDFWFKLHALQNHQALTQYFPEEGYFQAQTFSQLAWQRLTMLFHPTLSGWGRAAVLFWPAAMLVLVANGAGRPIALWAMGTYLFIALAPVNYRNGFHPFPEFEGRHILMACVPFALCFAWMVHAIGSRLLRPVWLQRGWPLVLLVMLVLSRTSYGVPNGFRHRPTQRVGEAIEKIVSSTPWEAGREIFLSAPMYVRYRVLFPVELRARLRVAVDGGAPDWWRHTTVDIESRHSRLPAPRDAYLIATPAQLRGEPEDWCYEVGLPRGDLAGWRRAAQVSAVVAHVDGSIAAVAGRNGDEKPLVVLVGAKSPGDARIAKNESGK